MVSAGIVLTGSAVLMRVHIRRREFRIDPVGLGPGVQVVSAIDDLSTEPIEGRPDTLVPPLRQLFSGADQIKIFVAKDVVPVIFE